jgi:hypothetical protein
MEGKVERRVGLPEDLHFVEMEPCVFGQLDADEPGLGALERHGQGLLVLDAVERRPVVPIRLAPGAAVGREENAKACGPLGGRAAAVPHDDAVERLDRAQIDLPPGLVLAVGVEAEGAVLDAVNAAGCRPAALAHALRRRRGLRGAGRARRMARRIENKQPRQNQRREDVSHAAHP